MSALTLSSASIVAAPAAPFDLPARTVVATFHAEGAQIYECAATPGGNGLAWTFREPIAALIEDGKTVGRHYAGPHWALDDGSLVRARMAETLAGATPADISLLKLDVTENAGRGRLGPVTEIYRINTRSGALQGTCGTPGELRSVAYSADYVCAR